MASTSWAYDQRSQPSIDSFSFDIPTQCLSIADQNVGTENPTYCPWITQDQLLLSWLQSMQSWPESLAAFVLIGFKIASMHISKSSFVFFSNALNCKQQLYLTLYWWRVSPLYQGVDWLDSLASVGDPLPPSQHVHLILLRSTSWL